MALSTVQDILAGLPGWFTLDLDRGDQSSGTGAGDTIVKVLRDPYWIGHGETRWLKPNEVRIWGAKLRGVDGGRLFLGYDFRSFFPAAYPKGVWPSGDDFDGISAQVSAIGDDGRSLKLSHLPEGFAGTLGDMASVSYGSGAPAPLALFQAAEAFVAGADGVTGYFEVLGAIPAAVDVGDAVAVKKPSCHMIIKPGSLQIPNDKSAGGVISFDAIQVPTP